MQFKLYEKCIHKEVCMREAVLEGKDAKLNLDEDDLIECRHYLEDLDNSLNQSQEKKDE